MAVSSARAEVEAEERARTHLVGHGDRIKAKLELTTGHLNAQNVVMEDQSNMDNSLKAESDEVEKQIREVRLARQMQTKKSSYPCMCVCTRLYMHGSIWRVDFSTVCQIQIDELDYICVYVCTHICICMTKELIFPQCQMQIDEQEEMKKALEKQRDEVGQ